MVYDLAVEVVETPEPQSLPFKIESNTWSNGTTVTNGAYVQPSTTYWYDWNYTKTVYKYQLICPKCKTTNWGELDEVVTCSGIYSQERRPGGKKVYCKANLRAVSKKVDFDIPVGV